MDVVEAASHGSQRDLLVAMRARVASAVANPETPARDLAALTKRLMEITRDIEAIDAAGDDERNEQSGDVITEDEEFDPSTV